MHMQRCRTRYCLHVVGEPGRERAPQLAFAVMFGQPAQGSLQFLRAPALAQAGKQDGQCELVVAQYDVLRTVASTCLKSGARRLPGARQALPTAKMATQGEAHGAASLIHQAQL